MLSVYLHIFVLETVKTKKTASCSLQKTKQNNTPGL